MLQIIRLSASVVLTLLLSLNIAVASSLTSNQLDRLLNELSELIEENYVELDLAKEISAELKNFGKQSIVQSADSPEALAGVLTEFLKAYDGHFNVFWQDPAKRPPMIEESEADRQARQQQQQAATRRTNFGFKELRILEGNIGYLKLNQFSSASTPGAAQAAIAAMNFLASSDTVIIDLRQNGGGDPNMVQLLSSYLFEQPTYLNALYYRPTDTTQQFWTYADVQGQRFPQTPVYVLISGRTGSAAEEFAYNLKTRERATLVGQTTYGGANPGGVFPIMDGFSAFISTGKAINPVTNTNWEGVGVAPDVEVPANDALDWAIDDTLAKLASTTEDEQHQRELVWAAEARQTPLSLNQAQTNEYTGQFASVRTVELIDGQLTYLRGDRPPQIMLALGDDRFMLDGVDGFRLTFQRDDNGQINGMTENWVFGLVRPWPKL